MTRSRGRAARRRSCPTPKCRNPPKSGRNPPYSFVPTAAQRSTSARMESVTAVRQAESMWHRLDHARRRTSRRLQLNSRAPSPVSTILRSGSTQQISETWLRHAPGRRPFRPTHSNCRPCRPRILDLLRHLLLLHPTLESRPGVLHHPTRPSRSTSTSRLSAANSSSEPTRWRSTRRASTTRLCQLRRPPPVESTCPRFLSQVEGHLRLLRPLPSGLDKSLLPCRWDRERVSRSRSRPKCDRSNSGSTSRLRKRKMAKGRGSCSST